MTKDGIHLHDIRRILLGETPPVFLLEVLIRTLLVYIGLLMAVKALGKRTSGELTITEKAVIIMLGAVVSIPMQVPDRGILQGLLILLCIVGYQRGLTWLTIRSRKSEQLTQGNMCMLVKDGVLQLETMRKSRISHQQLFGEMRSRQVYNLGKVKRLYLESCGTFSLYQQKDPRPGLPIFPPDDEEILSTQQTAEQGFKVCVNCGTLAPPKGTNTACSFCGEQKWMDAKI